MLQAGGLVAAGLLLTACDKAVEVTFAQPFPAQAPNMRAFPARHRAVYTAADSNQSLCVGARAVWCQELRSQIISRHEADSVLQHRLTADTTYQEDGRLHYVKLMGRDSVRNSWLAIDTVFTLTGSTPGRLRRFQGRYYLNTPDDMGNGWQVQRLEIEGSRLTWQYLGQDTLRLLALDTATVRVRREKGNAHFELAPAPGTQTHRVGHYAGLWETVESYKRRQ
jgi:hypothetical protein